MWTKSFACYKREEHPGGFQSLVVYNEGPKKELVASLSHPVPVDKGIE